MANNELTTLRREEIAFHNPKLTNAVKRIADAMARTEKAGLQIAADIGNIYVKGLWEDDFDSFPDFAMNVFNLKKVQAYNLVRVCDWLVQKNGSYIGTSIFAGLGDFMTDFSTTKLLVFERMIGTDRISFAEEIVKDGLVTPYMSVKAIKDVIDRELNGEAEETEESDDTPDNTTENNETPDNTTENNETPESTAGDEEQTVIDLEEVTKPLSAEDTLIQIYAHATALLDRYKTMEMPNDKAETAREAMNAIITGLEKFAEAFNIDESVFIGTGGAFRV